MEDILQHHGVKGMKWGVRRTPAQLGNAKTKKPGTLRSEIKSQVREVKWQGKKKNISSMSDEEVKTLTERVRLENDMKRLATSKEEYRNRETLTTPQLKSRVARLQMEDNLKRQINTATKEQRKVAKALITELATTALTSEAVASTQYGKIVSESMKLYKKYEKSKN